LRGGRWPLGPAFTYLLTLAGAPSVPRAQSFPQRYPFRVDARLPPIAISARTPLADGNIALFADRWKLIDADTLPAYLAFIRVHPEKARALVATPLSQRVTGYRLLARAGQLAAGALTRWDVDLRAAPPGPRTPGARAARRPLQATATVIDLASAPTRQSAGFAAGTASRVWMSPGRVPFDVTVTLPGGRAYHAQAEMAVMLSSTRAGDPDRQNKLSGDPPSYEAIRTATALYVRYANGEQEYYNTARDPFELDNIASSGVPAALRTALAALANCHGGASCWAAAHLPR